jgi:hypothetical protein
VPVLHQDGDEIGQLGWLAQPRELSTSTISLLGCKRGWLRSNFVAIRCHEMEDRTQSAGNPGNVRLKGLPSDLLGSGESLP